MAKRILFDDSKNATGVVADFQNTEFTVSARKEIIISTGAFHSPQMLMVSGIGPAQTLKKHDISVLIDLPGVGQNLWDHVLFSLSYPVNMDTVTRFVVDPQYQTEQILRYMAYNTGVPAQVIDMLGWEKVPFPYRKKFPPAVQADLAQFPTDWPEVEIIGANFFVSNFSNMTAQQPTDGRSYASIVGALVVPTSSGDVTIRSKSTKDLPVINPNWLTTQTDIHVAIATFQRIRDLWRTGLLKKIVIGPEAYPGEQVVTDAQILHAIRDAATPIWHPAGTCKMGTSDDPRAVLDSSARVFGVGRLRVVDASAFPLLPPGHPQSTVYMLAEKIVAQIIAEASSSRSQEEATLPNRGILQESVTLEGLIPCNSSHGHHYTNHTLSFGYSPTGLMDSPGSPDYKALFEQEREKRKHFEDQQKQTTLVEFLRHCHKVLSRPLRVRTPSSSTTGEIPIPKGKHCPTRLERWVDCAAKQQDIYNAVRRYLQPEDAPRLFPSRVVLDGLSEHFKGPMGSEYDLQTYERLTVEDHTRILFSELCKIPAARDEFGLGDGVLFDSHASVLTETEINETYTKDTTPRGKPDQLFVHRVDDRTATLLTTVEYKPPHKLPLGDIRRGLRDMDLWKEMVWSNKVPRDGAESSVYNSQRLVCSAIVQEYHVMIQEGLEFSYLTTGLALILLWVPYDKPSTLRYYFCEPNQEVDNSDGDLPHPNTSIARVLCLCLMSFRSRLRNQEWRNKYCSDLRVWTTRFDGVCENVRSQQLQQGSVAPSDGTDYVSPISAANSSEYQASSSPVESPTAPARRVPTRSRGGCAPSDLGDHTGSPDSSGSESDHAASGRKRGFSQVEASPSQRLPRQNERDNQNDMSQRQNAQFCTQRCLLGLQNGRALDDSCPNVDLHRQSGDGVQHPINATDLVFLLKQQMDENIDRCIPFGSCGSYGAPFKLTCSPYGYTVVGKGTTSGLWKKVVSREAEIYHILRKAQGSAVPVFLGTIDLAKIYYLHQAGEIRHMLVMGWAGESTAKHEQTAELHREIKRSKEKIRTLGVRHLDLRPDNILWNAELGRALIIDFHRSELDYRPTIDRFGSLKGSQCKAPMSETKRVRVI
ncbi:hypothetical protein BO71DRAFT_434460 [Aspergillus ellipticus CBS 707.79]|uniref:Glucose-methanol-choline oxidoreductase N-terminal domain-containing protein n=1 Tax=Aspergillus ellipticus CBS 707.79 TaxID=1448320 RepID=A0A319DP05_9EURO|nr:hypothetical protein BO71DRAFT_434460 [Aspergillus ellipticus CBS 707.79]